MSFKVAKFLDVTRNDVLDVEQVSTGLRDAITYQLASTARARDVGEFLARVQGWMTM